MILYFATVMLAASHLVMYLRRNSNCWVGDLGDGFSVNNGYRMRSVKDDEIVGVSTIGKLADYWKPPGAVRHLKVWLADGTPPLTIDTFIPAGQADPLGDMISRIESTVAERLLQTLAKTGSIDEAEWWLSHTELRIKHGTNRETVPLDQVTKIEAVGGMICIWLDQSVKPSAQIIKSSRNADLLLRLLKPSPDLWRPVLGQADAATVPAAREPVLSPVAREPVLQPLAGDKERPTQLGRQLFQYASYEAKILIALWAVAMGAGVWAAIYRSNHVLLTISAPLAVIFAVAVWYVPPSRFICYEEGVVLTNVFGRKQFYFNDLVSFGFETIVPVQTMDQPGSKFRFETDSLRLAVRPPMRPLSDGVQHVISTASKAVAQRMRGELQRAGRVAWTKAATLFPDRIEFLVKGAMPSDQPRRIVYNCIARFTIEKETLEVYDDQSLAAVLSIKTSERNFYPGFVLFQDLCTANQPRLQT